MAIEFFGRFSALAGRGVRLAVALAAVLAAGAVRAEWLWWTTDFTYDWGNEGTLATNPAGEGVNGYDIYLVVKNADDGSWATSIKGGALVDDQLSTEEGGILMQTDVSDFASDEYVFFVEMVKSGESSSKIRYLSQDYSYSSLVAAGYVAEEMEAYDMPWNPAVGAWMVPEPSGGMLVLWGFGLLALRRRRES